MYYNLVKQMFDGKSLPCYAMYNEVQISPTGEVWSCSVIGESAGNLRDNNYSLKKIWKSKKAKKIRKRVDTNCCKLIPANVSYTNLINNPKTALKVIWQMMTE